MYIAHAQCHTTHQSVFQLSPVIIFLVYEEEHLFEMILQFSEKH